MKLLVDVGNTALKCALADGVTITHINTAAIPWSQLECILIASVRDNQELADLILLAQAHQVPTHRASVQASCAQICCAYPEFQNLGIDRWLVVLAAAHHYANQHVIIVDAGTATTVDIVSKQKLHLGGWIIPGIDLMMHSITERAEKVFQGTSPSFELALGKDTPAAVSQGCLAASIGLVNVAKQQLEEASLTVCTGGYGELLQKSLTQSVFHDDFIFKGLLIWYQNQEF